MTFYLMVDHMHKILIKIASVLRTMTAFFLITIFCIIVFPIIILSTFVPDKYRYNKFLYFLLYISYRVIAYSLFLPIEIHGKRHILKEPMIIVANHQSVLDIPLLGILLGLDPHIWLVLSYYSELPIFGLLIRRLFIPVNKSNTASSGKALIKLLRLSKKHSAHTIIFPEGGRFNDDQIHPFSHGLALLAKKTGQPVLPVFMPNNGKAFSPEDLIVSYTCLKIIIGKTFLYKEHDTDESFIERIRDWFIIENNKNR